MKSPSGILSWQKITIFLSRIFTKNFCWVLPEYPENSQNHTLKSYYFVTFQKRKKNAQSANKEKMLKIKHHTPALPPKKEKKISGLRRLILLSGGDIALKEDMIGIFMFLQNYTSRDIRKYDWPDHMPISKQTTKVSSNRI